MEKDDLIRFRMEIEEFVDSEPLPAGVLPGDFNAASVSHPAGSSKSGGSSRIAPYSLVVGLARVTWLLPSADSATRTFSTLVLSVRARPWALFLVGVAQAAS